jgi:hypothetical protein
MAEGEKGGGKRSWSRVPSLNHAGGKVPAGMTVWPSAG